MLKRCLRCALIGATAGIALSYIAAIVVSCALELGYFMPCPAALPEIAGGEMNAVILQTAVCALAGAGVGALIPLCRRTLRP